VGSEHASRAPASGIHRARGGLDARDPALEEAKKPCSTIEEFDGYVWARTPEGQPNKEQPEKADDHGMDASRYLVAQLDIRGGGKMAVGADIWAM
jgi:phage terminase large subunit